jgi:amino acid transporter
VESDSRQLARLGYPQELLRRLGGFSSFAIGFSVISVVTGIASTFGDALAAGGPAGPGLGWPLVACGTLVVALAMAELASAFPTAGALYHWACLLGGSSWGWATAMLNLVGQVAIVAAIDLACAEALAGLIRRPDAAYVLFATVLSAHAVLNIASVRLVAWLNDASATVHIVGVVLLSVALLAAGRVHPLSYLARTEAAPGTGSSYAVGFMRSLVLGVWTFTGFDAAAHVSEETHDPQRRAPTGIVSSVAVSAVAGFALVVALTLSVRDLPSTAGAPDAALVVLSGALGGGTARAAMILVATAMWFAGLASLTSASRMLFAFARDRGVPWASSLRRVHRITRTPVNATCACAVAACVLVGITACLAASVFLAVAALATAALYASYALPIALGAIARGRGRWTKVGPWNLGGGGVALAWAAVLWTAFVELVCALANRLAMEMFAGALLGLLVLWVAWVRPRFRGPPVTLAHFEQGPQ